MSGIELDSPTYRDNALRMAVRRKRSLHDGCVLVLAGDAMIEVRVYGETLFEYHLDTGWFRVCLPQRGRWVVQKINACLSGVLAPVRAYMEADGTVKITNGGPCPRTLCRGGEFRWYGGAR